jgi:hypothetical protein
MVKYFAAIFSMLAVVCSLILLAGSMGFSLGLTAQAIDPVVYTVVMIMAIAMTLSVGATLMIGNVIFDKLDKDDMPMERFFDITGGNGRYDKGNIQPLQAEWNVKGYENSNSGI